MLYSDTIILTSLC